MRRGAARVKLWKLSLSGIRKAGRGWPTSKSATYHGAIITATQRMAWNRKGGGCLPIKTDEDSMRRFLKTALIRLHLYGVAKRARKRLRGGNVRLLKFPPYDADVHRIVVSSPDPIRYAMIALAIASIKEAGIEGSLAEAGVYRGETSRLIHALAPERTFYLFDTFEGFPQEDLERPDDRFRDTGVQAVMAAIGDTTNVVIRKGYFPETARGLEDEVFAFVMLDLDLHKPTLAGLEFFYPRLVRGGYLFAHDYNSPESNWAVSRAVNEFMEDKAESMVEIPDTWGSAVFRKA